MIWQAWEAQNNNNILGAINTQNQYSKINTQILKKISYQYSNTRGGSLHFIQQLLIFDRGLKQNCKYKHGVSTLITGWKYISFGL